MRLGAANSLHSTVVRLGAENTCRTAYTAPAWKVVVRTPKSNFQPLYARQTTHLLQIHKIWVSEDPYLSLDWQCRTALTKVRISAHNLNIEQGWYARSENTLAGHSKTLPLLLHPWCCLLQRATFSGPEPDNWRRGPRHMSCRPSRPAQYSLPVSRFLADDLKTALLKRDYRSMFTQMSNHQKTAYMIGKAVQKMLLALPGRTWRAETNLTLPVFHPSPCPAPGLRPAPAPFYSLCLLLLNYLIGLRQFFISTYFELKVYSYST